MGGVKNCLVILLYINTSLIWEPLEPRWIWERLLAWIQVLRTRLQATWGKDFLCSAQLISVHIDILKYRASDDWFLVCFLLPEPSCSWSWCWEVSVWPLGKVWIGGYNGDSTIPTGLWGHGEGESVDLEWSLVISDSPQDGLLESLGGELNRHQLKGQLAGSSQGKIKTLPFPGTLVPEWCNQATEARRKWKRPRDLDKEVHVGDKEQRAVVQKGEVSFPPAAVCLEKATLLLRK